MSSLDLILLSIKCDTIHTYIHVRRHKNSESNHKLFQIEIFFVSLRILTTTSMYIKSVFSYFRLENVYTFYVFIVNFRTSQYRVFGPCIRLKSKYFFYMKNYCIFITVVVVVVLFAAKYLIK